MIFNLGYLPIIQAGNSVDANSDLVCLGGMFTINLFISPVASLLNLSAIIL